jgi:hypothetical protein
VRRKAHGEHALCVPPFSTAVVTRRNLQKEFHEIPSPLLCLRIRPIERLTRMKMFPRFLFLAFALSFGPATQALTLPVSEDTSSSAKGQLTKPAGAAGTLTVASNRPAFIRFDVGTFSGSVFAADVTRARLVCYLPRVTRRGALKLHAVTSPWTESVTATTPQPTFDLTPLVTIPSDAVVAKQFLIVDVTVQVKAWLNNPSSDFGFALLSDGTANVILGAKEGPGTGHPATLEVESVPNGSGIIDVVKLGTGDVDNGEFAFLNGVTSPIQTQFTNLSIADDNFQLSLDSLLGDLNEISGKVDGKVSKAGDAMTGPLLLPADGLSAGINQFVLSNGRVGIGTFQPNVKLDVRGEVKLGSSGQYFAPGAQEDLRIVRGTVRYSNGATAIVAGSGFSVSAPSVGDYTITFDTPFPTKPTITTTLEFEDNSVTVLGLRVLTTQSVIIENGASLNNTSVHFIAVGPK